MSTCNFSIILVNLMLLACNNPDHSGNQDFSYLTLLYHFSFFWLIPAVGKHLSNSNCTKECYLSEAEKEKSDFGIIFVPWASEECWIKYYLWNRNEDLKQRFTFQIYISTTIHNNFLLKKSATEMWSFASQYFKKKKKKRIMGADNRTECYKMWHREDQLFSGSISTHMENF